MIYFNQANNLTEHVLIYVFFVIAVVEVPTVWAHVLMLWICFKKKKKKAMTINWSIFYRFRRNLQYYRCFECHFNNIYWSSNITFVIFKIRVWLEMLVLLYFLVTYILFYCRKIIDYKDFWKHYYKVFKKSKKKIIKYNTEKNMGFFFNV